MCLSLRQPSALFLVALLGITPAAAQGQFGGLIKKKVVDAASDRAKEKTGLTQPDAKLGNAFTADALDRLLNGLELKAKWVVSSDSIARIVEPLEKELAAMRSNTDDKFNAYDAKLGEWRVCRNDTERAYNAAHKDQNEAAAKALAAKVKADPALGQRMIAEMSQMQTQANSALARGDTAGAKQLAAVWYKKWGIDPPGLTPESAYAKCGREPVAPAGMAARAELEARISALRTQQREVGESGQEKAQAASGLNAAEFYQRTERLERWYYIEVRGKKGVRFWSDEEAALFEARRPRIERVFALLKA